MKRKIIILQGNISCGKSTMLKNIDETLYNVIDEDMESFTKLENFNPLKLFYTKEISPFIFSVYIYTIFMDIIMSKLSDTKINIICRSPIDAFKVFNKISNDISEIENLISDKLLNIFLDSLKNDNVKIIYLEASSEICFKRLCERNREEESSVSLEYLEKLNNAYNKSLEDSKIEFVKINSETSIENVVSLFLQVTKNFFN